MDVKVIVAGKLLVEFGFETQLSVRRTPHLFALLPLFPQTHGDCEGYGENTVRSMPGANGDFAILENFSISLF
jgi:hypothetical protein